MTVSLLRRLSVAWAFALGLGLVGYSPMPASAQEPLLHLPLDGSLVNRGSIGGKAQLFTADDAAPPEFVRGHRGQALHFNSESVVALPFELDHVRYPQVTITAWVRNAPDASGTRAVLASGSSAGARMHVGGRLAARAGRTGVSFDEPMPAGEWVFVASVVDTAAGWARLHQNESVYRRDGLPPGSKPPRKVRAPDDLDAEPVAWLTVGGATLTNWQQTTRAVSIDDVRLYLAALSEEQVEAIRTASMPAPADSTQTEQPVTARSLRISMPCDTNANCAPGEYCARDRSCHPESHLPFAGNGTTLDEMQQRSAERNAGMLEGVATDSPTGVLPGGAADPVLVGMTGESPSQATSAGSSGGLPDSGQQIANPDTQAVIRGTVTNDAGDRLPDVRVIVLRVTNGRNIADTRTGPDGSYSVVVYATEDVYVYAPRSEGLPYSEFPERRRLKLEPGKVFHADLQRVITPCTIEGRVTHTSGQSLPGIRVGIYDPDNFNPSRPPAPLRSTTSDEDGRFRIEFKGIRDWEAVEPAWVYTENISQHVGFMPRLHAIDPTGVTVLRKAPDVQFVDFYYLTCSNKDWSVLMRSP